MTIFNLNPVQFFGSVAFVFLLSSAFVSLFSLCACYACYFFFYQKPESCSNASFEVVLSCHNIYY